MNLSNIIWYPLAFMFVGVAEMLIAVMHIVVFMVLVLWIISIDVLKAIASRVAFLYT